MPHAVPRRVLYVANAAKIGGGAKVLMDLMRNLASERYRPLLVAPGRGQITEWAESAGVPFYVSPAGDWATTPGLARRSLSLLRLMVRERISIVHAAAPTCYRAAGVAARLAGVARVCHLGFPPEPGELQRSFVAAPDAVIGCYDAQAREHEADIRRLNPDCHVVGVCNGIDTSRFVPMEAAASLRRGAPQVVGILGHISTVKGHPEFVDAAALLARDFPNARFLVIGGESEQQGIRSVLEAKVAQLGLTPRFDFLGFRNDIPAVLASVDVVALPSHAEGLPLAVLEAMACAKPVVATPVGGVPEAVLDGVTGLLVPPGSASALADALRQVLAQPQQAIRMGLAGRARIAEHFTVQRFVGRVQRTYDAVLADEKSSRPSIAS